MKILLATDTYEDQVCGISTSVATLKDELINRGHDVRVLLTSKDNESRIIEKDYLIESFSLRLIDFRQPIKGDDEILEEIVSWNPDIIHIQTEWRIGRIAREIALKCDCPYINTSHTFWEEFTKGLIPSSHLRESFSKRLLKSCYSESSAIVVPSEKMISYLHAIDIELPLHTIPTGVDLDMFNQGLSDIEKDSLKRELDLNGDSKILLYIGRVAKEKNLDELIDFLPDLISRNGNIKLLIVGEGPYLNHIKGRVKSLSLDGHVRFAGLIPPEETYKYYAIGDIFVSPSTCETQGITYMEALASSCPLVCRYDDVLEDVIENGYNGFTYGNKEEFLSSILRILDNEDEHDELRRNAFTSSLRFSKSRFGEEIEKLYLDILDDEQNEIN